MMQSSSSSDEDYMEFDGSNLSRKGGYLTEHPGLKDFRDRTCSRMQYLGETDSTTSARSRQTTAPSTVVGTEPLLRRSGFESQHSIPQATPLTIRTSSLKVHRSIPPHSSSSIYSFADENKSHQVVTLQTPLLSAEDRSSSERSNQWSSSDLSSIRSCSVISVPVTSHDKTRPYHGSIFGTSFSSSATGGMGHIDELQNGRLPSPAKKTGETGETFQIRDGTPGISDPSPDGLNASVDAAEELHKLRLQLYVFVLRCIAYPFTVPLPQDPVRRYLKVTREYLGVLRERFTAFLNRDLQIVCDEAFFNAVQHFDEIYLRNEFVERAVIAGGFSMNDIRGVFVRSIEQRLQRFEEIDGLPKQTVIGAWKVKFDQICRGGEGPCPIANRLGSPQLELTNPTKEQLYDLFMRILFIKKYEHQILYNACQNLRENVEFLQLDSIDEQAAQVRRELADRKSFLEEMAANRRYPKMVHKEMEVQYVEEQINSLNQLMLQLDTVPVGKSHGYTAGPASAVGVVVQLQRRLKKCSGHAQTAQNLSSTVGIQGSQNGGFDARRGGAAGLSPGRHTSIIAWTANEGQQQQHQQLLIDGTNMQLLSSINHASGNASKLSIQLSFTLEVLLRRIHSVQILICQLRPLRHLSGSKQLFCTIEVEGCPERQRTAFVKAAKPIWDTLAEFETPHPLPCVKIKLMKESTGPLSLDHKELGRIVLLPNPSTSHLPTWYRLQSTKRCNDIIQMQIAVRQERPSNLKHCGFCWVQGRSTFKKWKIRYLCLIQVSQYTFIMAAFKEAKSVAYESMILDGYTVDYCETNQDLVSAAKAELATEPGGLSSSMPTLNKVKGPGSLTSAFGGTSGPKNCSVAIVPTSREVASLQGSVESGGGAFDSLLFSHRLPRFFFNLVREGDALTFAVFEESELHAWVQAIHRATGQSHKPILPTHVISKTHFRKGDCDGAHHLGVNALVAVKPHKADHLPLLKELLVRMLDYRLKDPFVSLGWLSPSQSLVLEEYCNRYSIRECQRYLIFLNELLNLGEQNLMIDIDLIFHSYVLCADHVQGKTQENGINTVLNAEMDEFQRVRTRLLAFLEKRLTGFRFHFPFNRPDGGLEKLLLLLDRVIAHSNEGITTTEAVRSMVRVCLRNAAVLNYEKISEFAQQEAKKKESPSDAGLHTHEKRLRDLLRLAEICVDTLQQNDDYFAKSFIWYGDLFVEHSENFLSLFQMDMTDVLDNLPSDNWDVFQIFQFLNNCLLNSETLANGPFHTALLDRFAPLVESYLSLTETSITKFMISGIEKESWTPIPGEGPQNVASSNDLNVGSSVSSQTHPDTDNESYRSLNIRRQNRSLRQTPTEDVIEEADNSPSPIHNGLHPSSTRQVRISKSSNVGPTSAFLDVLSRSRPLAFVSHVMNPSASMRSSAVSAGRRSIVLITPMPKNSGFGDNDQTTNGEQMEHFELAAELICARCCRTVGSLIFRLYALKDFIAELGWPERIRAAGWAEKTRKMCSSLLREAAKRTLVELDLHLRQANKSTDFIVPLECLTMINTITAIRMQLFSLCHRHESEVTGDGQQGTRSDSSGDVSISQPSSVRMYTETEAFLEGVHRQMSVILTDHLAFVLSTVLNRLARYDEGNLISSILTLAKPVDEDGRNYAQFISSNLQILCQNLVDDVYLLSIFENWYTTQLRLIHEWLMQRRTSVLHPYQIKCLATIVRKAFSDFELQGVATHVLENMTYKNVCHRLQVEEATLSVSSSAHDRPPSSSPSSAADGRQNLIRAIGDGLSTLAQGAGLRHRQL